MLLFIIFCQSFFVFVFCLVFIQYLFSFCFIFFFYVMFIHSFFVLDLMLLQFYYYCNSRYLFFVQIIVIALDCCMHFVHDIILHFHAFQALSMNFSIIFLIIVIVCMYRSCFFHYYYKTVLFAFVPYHFKFKFGSLCERYQHQQHVHLVLCVGCVIRTLEQSSNYL